MTGNDSNGTASETGGGAIWNVGNVYLDGCTFDSNTAQKDGGAVWHSNGSGATPEFAACIFTGNTAKFSGGAVYEKSDSANVIYLNSLFVGNKAMGSTGNEGGGAIYAGGDPMTAYINCTFVGNEARTGQGGGMRVRDNESPIVTNCIFWDNCVGNDCTTQDEDAQIHISGSGNNDSVTHSTLEGCADPGFCEDVDDANTAVEPTFAGAGLPHPYALTDVPANAPLIDDGDGAESTHGTCPSVNESGEDLAGNSRFVHKDGVCVSSDANFVDMGAYEVQ